MQKSVLGVDLGGTKILIGEMNTENQLLNYRRFPSDVSTQENAIRLIKKCIRIYLKEEELMGIISEISVAVVGRVDPDKGTWFEIHPGNSQKINLKRELQEEFNIPVTVTNDVTAAAEAERKYGIGRGVENFVYLNVGTGIAGRVISGGKFVSGGNFNAGEVGHTVVSMGEAPICSCGRKGCIEAFASGLGMSNEAHRLKERYPTRMTIHDGERVSVDMLISAYEQGDSLAKVVVERAASGLAELIMNLVRVSDPEAVIVGGGVIGNDRFFQLVNERLKPKTMRFVVYQLQQTKMDTNFITLKGCGSLGIEALQERWKTIEQGAV